MDEEAERAKLKLLDLTDDVIELILDKKRKSYALRHECMLLPPVPPPKTEELPYEELVHDEELRLMEAVPPEPSRREAEPTRLPDTPPVYSTKWHFLSLRGKRY